MGQVSETAQCFSAVLKHNTTLAILNLGANNFSDNDANLLSPLLFNPNLLLITSSEEKTNTLKQANNLAEKRIKAYERFWQYLENPEKATKSDLTTLACCRLGLYALKCYWQLTPLNTNKSLLSKITSKTSLIYCFTTNDIVRNFTVGCGVEFPNELVDLILDTLFKVEYVNMVVGSTNLPLTA